MKSWSRSSFRSEVVLASSSFELRAESSLAGPGDCVVLAGKGHEQGQETAGVVAPFDDRAVAREALREAGYS